MARCHEGRVCEAQGGVVFQDWVQAAGFDAPAREDTLTGTRPGELIHAAFELTGFVDRGYQTADLKASGVIGISIRHLDSSTWHLDAASQGVGMYALYMYADEAYAQSRWRR